MKTFGQAAQAALQGYWAEKARRSREAATSEVDAHGYTFSQSSAVGGGDNNRTLDNGSNVTYARFPNRSRGGSTLKARSAAQCSQIGSGLTALKVGSGRLQGGLGLRQPEPCASVGERGAMGVE